MKNFEGEIVPGDQKDHKRGKLVMVEDMRGRNVWVGGGLNLR